MTGLDDDEENDRDDGEEEEGEEEGCEAVSQEGVLLISETTDEEWSVEKLDSVSELSE